MPPCDRGAFLVPDDGVELGDNADALHDHVPGAVGIAR